MIQQSFAALALGFAVVFNASAAVLPADSISEGVREAEGWLMPEEGRPATVKGAYPSNNSLTLSGRSGKNGTISISFIGPDWKPVPVVSFKAMDRSVVQMAGYTRTADVVYPDQALSVTWGGVKKGTGRYSVRPNPGLYSPKAQEQRKAEWEKLPGASEQAFSVELRPAGKSSLELRVNGQFLDEVTLPESLGAYPEYEVRLTNDASIASVELPPVPDARSLALPVNQYPRVHGETIETEVESSNSKLENQWVAVDGMPDAVLDFERGAELPADFRSLVNHPAKGIAVGGLGKIRGLANIDLQSLFWTRSSTDSLPEQRLFSVPLAAYSHAEILCAVDDNPDHVDAFTLRVTRYGASRGNAMADTLVKVPRNGDKSTGLERRVGTVTFGPKDARKTASLWLITAPIHNGAIGDLLFRDTRRSREMGTHRYLDVELLDPLETAEKAKLFPPYLGYHRRDWLPIAGNPVHSDTPPTILPTSGVTVFGINLKRSPASLEVRSNIGIQAFYASDRPEWIARVMAAEDGNYQLRWEFADVDGTVVSQGTRALALTKGAEENIAIPVEVKVGWYAARFQVEKGKDQPAFEARTSFVMLLPDTRKAGFESPFYGWWFGAGHGMPPPIEEFGPLFQRLGIRRVNLTDDMPESKTQVYGITRSHIEWSSKGGGRDALNNFRDGKMTLPEALAMQEASIQKYLEKWPHIDRMLVFHESGDQGAPFPTELWGQPASTSHIATDQEENSPEALLAREGAANPVAARKAKQQKDYQKHWPVRMEYLKGMAEMVRAKFPQLKMQYGNNGDSLRMIGEIFRRKFPREFIDTISVEDLGQTYLPENVQLGSLHSAWYLRELARKTGYGDVPVTACTEWIGRMTERLGPQPQAEWKTRDGLLALAYGFDTISIAGLNDSGTGYYFSPWGNGNLCTHYPSLAPKPAFAAIATLTQVLDQAKFQRFVPSDSMVTYVQEFRRGEEWVYAIWVPRGKREVTLSFPNAEDRALFDLYGREQNRDGKSVSLTASTAPQYLVSKSKIDIVTPGDTSFPDVHVPQQPGTIIPLESLEEVEIVSEKKRETNVAGLPGNLPHLKEGEFLLKEVEDPVMGRCLEVELLPNAKLRWEMEREYVVLKLKQPVPTDAKNAGVWVKGNGSWGTVSISKSQRIGPWASNANRHFNWRALSAMNFEGWNFIEYPYLGETPEAENQVQGLFITLPRTAVVGTEMAPVQNLKIRIKSIVLY